MNTSKMIALAAALAVVMPAMAQTPLKPFPLSAKYRDTGAKPATGRSGSAAIEARALLGADGTTDLEVTTGHFEGGGPSGELAKVQVKLLAPNGDVMQTDNYRKSIAGAGFTSFSYDSLHRGQPAQVQASVTGIDANRTDIVTVSTDVKLRPDLVAGVNAQSVATVNSMVVVGGVMKEMNGEVGARATCRLLVDGVEIASIPGAWVDAASAVTCRFLTSFSAPGTKRLTVRITDVSPGDFDTANNEATRSIDVVPPQPFDSVLASVQDSDGWQHTRSESTFTPYSGVMSRATYELEAQSHTQSFFVAGYFYGASPLDAGQIILRHSTGATVLPMIAVNVADLPDGWSIGDFSCRTGNFPGFYASICSDATSSATEVLVGRDAGEAVYTIERATVTGPEYAGWGNYDNSGTTYSVPGLVALGSSYKAELRHELGGIAHASQFEVPLVQRHWLQDDAAPRCSSISYPSGISTYCLQTKADVRYITGEVFIY